MKVNQINFSEIEGVCCTDKKVAEVERMGTETDGQPRIVRDGLFETDNPDVFEVYKSCTAHNNPLSTLMTKQQVLNEYTVFKVGTRIVKAL